MQPSIAFRIWRVVEKMKNSFIKNLFFRIIKKNKGISFLLVLAVCGVVLTSLIPPQILKLIIDRNLAPKNQEGLLTLALAYIIVIFLIGIFDFVKETLLTMIGQKITREIRYDMMEKLSKINIGYFTSNGSGFIVSRFMNDVDAINSMFTQGIIGIFVDCFKVIGILVSIWIFSSNLGIITLFLIPLIYYVTRYFQKRMLAAQIKNRILVGRVNNHIGESIKNVHMIKTYSKESYMEKKYTHYLLDNYKTIEKINFYDSIFPPIIQITRAVLIAFIIIVSSRQLNYLGISLGMIAASIDLVSNLFAPVEQLGMEFQNIQQAVSGARRVNEFLKTPEEEEKNTELLAERILPDADQVTLQFHEVSFSYEEGTDILQDISLQIKPKEKVAFIGRTGVGKSTLFKLILGLMKPNQGCITINGIDVCQIPNSEKRRIFGYVDQSFPLIKGTVAEQISLKDKSITREMTREALEYVGMTDYISTLADGLDTNVSDALFSHGQKQLLSIARAIVTNPPVLLLDEITANLDSLTEEKIVTVLQKISTSRIILSISHRLSSIISSDTVVILEKGRIKNSGSPEVLLKSDDWYRSNLEMENLTWS
jgi:ATP-binding cassette subfamily B protein